MKLKMKLIGSIKAGDPNGPFKYYQWLAIEGYGYLNGHPITPGSVFSWPEKRLGRRVG